jgi:protein arginine kinase activator
MICERCHNAEATVHLTEIIKDVRSEVHLCESCAREIGFNSKISGIGSFMSVNQSDFADSDASVCPLCGTDDLEISENGRAGCPFCYTVFDSAFSALCGDAPYNGKVPGNRSETVRESVNAEPVRENPSIESLKIELDTAVQDERYEDAAKIRDLIREREESFTK